MTSLYFRQYSHSGEQELAQSIIDEMIQIHGMPVYYVPRLELNIDDVLTDDKLSKFYNAYPIMIFIENVEGFGGSGDFLTQFGLELRDQISFSVSKREFQKQVAQHDPRFQFTGETYMGQPVVRPREGDVIYLPMNQKLYQIRFVEHEMPFYQFGKLQCFSLRTELYSPNNELYDTGVSEIDAIFDQYNINQLASTGNGPPNVLLDATSESMILSADDSEAITTTDQSHDPNSGSPEDHSEDITQEANDITDFSEDDPFGEIS